MKFELIKMTFGDLEIGEMFIWGYKYPLGHKKVDVKTDGEGIEFNDDPVYRLKLEEG